MTKLLFWFLSFEFWIYFEIWILSFGFYLRKLKGGIDGYKMERFSVAKKIRVR